MKNKINLKKHKSLPSPSDIKKVEVVIGDALPSDYVDFMLKYNDFMPEIPKPYCYKIEWGNKRGSAPYKEASIGGWERITHSDNENSIISSINNLWEPGWELIPRDVIPIGNGGGGGLILLGISGNNYGQIFYWYDGSPYEPGEPTYENIGFIANNFTEFLESLYPCEE